MLPQVFWAGFENTDVSKYFWPGPMPPRISGVPLTFGRCVFPGAASVVPLAVKLIGVPE